MIAIIAAIAELLFFSAIAAITAIVAIIWKPGFREPEKLHVSALCKPLKPGFHMIAAIAGKCFPYDRYDRWKVRSLNFFFLSDHSDHNDHMETRLYRWRFFSLLLILEKWMIHSFRPSQKVWTKFRQNLHQSYFVCLFFFSSNQFKLRQKALKNYLYKRILKTAKLSQNKNLRSSNLTGVETLKVRLFRSTSTERKLNQRV